MSIVNLPDGLAPGPHHFEGRWYLAGVADDVREANIVFD